MKQIYIKLSIVVCRYLQNMMLTRHRCLVSIIFFTKTTLVTFGAPVVRVVHHIAQSLRQQRISSESRC